jgi:(1->4)-alpha-D-glucan 1-alpha-D-glucosylmutase
VPAETLGQLSERYGIAPSYRDIWGHEHAATPDTSAALLAAMGVTVDDAAGAMTADDGGTVCAVPAEKAPPLVLRAGAMPRTLHLSLPAPPPSPDLRWTLTLESGAAREGPAALFIDERGVAQVECRGLPRSIAEGYHRLALVSGDAEVSTTALIACPDHCPAPGAPGMRLFGPAIQLYALRSRRNWGIGDFTDLANLVVLAARHGAGFVGLNPLHALFPDRPVAASPYSPSTRLALNPLYLDVEAIADYAECASVREQVASAAFRERLDALRAAPLVDYPGVAAAKLPLLAQLFAHFHDAHLVTPDARGRALRAFGATNRETAGASALFDTLQSHFARQDAAAWGWPAWPAQFRDAHADVVRRFAQQEAYAVDFHLYLQWQADRQLAAAAAAAADAGMPLRLYRDLAVGASPGGAETWHAPTDFALAAHVGAPPDAFNPAGQDWGLPPWIPHRIAARDYAPWAALLRANMRHAGALRIDHVMGLRRLYWVPRGRSPREGAYVAYPIEALGPMLALEARRNGCVVVGEDLGTVPDEVRDTLHALRVHSYRVLWFERTHDGSFTAPEAYPAQALVTVSTHDLPTLQGFWQGSDLAARDALGLYPDAALRDAQHAERTADRARLLRALDGAGLASWPPGPADAAGMRRAQPGSPDRSPRPSTGASAGSEPVSSPDAPAPLTLSQVCAVHAYVARTPCALMTLQLEDVFGESAQVNLPATTDDRHPNWRRKLTVDLEDFDDDGRFAAVCAAIRAQGRGVPDGGGAS